MMENAQDILKSFLDGRKSNHSLRQLSAPANLIDFYSNDYLGLANSYSLSKLTESIIAEKNSGKLNGSTGSRLLSGNSIEHLDLEKLIAEFHDVESALLFNSGYDANLGLMSCLTRPEDSIYYDELSHASILDGIKLAKGSSYKFRHNDISDLETKLSNGSGVKFVIAESIYSMDGDLSPMLELYNVCQKYNANLIIDEAHSAGIYGSHGRGLVNESSLSKNIFARIVTYGKAFGCHGAAVLGSTLLKDYLINRARPFIYSTALAPHAVSTISAAYRLMPELDNTRSQLFKNISFFNSLKEVYQMHSLQKCNSAIQSLIIPGNHEVKLVAESFQKSGYGVKPILSPTVPKGKERLRICIHAFNTEEELKALAQLIKKTTHELSIQTK